jgi:hypothetical protein
MEILNVQVVFICILNFFYGLNSESLCIKCPSICEGCFWKESTSNFGCKSCHIGYTLKDDQCLSCPNIPQLGTGCEDCSYDKSLDKFKCYSCTGRNYCNVTNTYECISNTDQTNTQLYGCLGALYNSTTHKYECYKCDNEFIPILNDKNCRLPSSANLGYFCDGANNIGTQSAPIYSCISCKSQPYHIDYTDVIDFRGAHDCYVSKNELILCEKATKDETGNLQCTKCKGNFRFVFNQTYNKNICDENCDPESFKKNNCCYKCDDKYNGNPGCLKEKGCEYKISNGQLNCTNAKLVTSIILMDNASISEKEINIVHNVI